MASATRSRTTSKFGGFDPFREYVKKVDLLFEELLAAIDTEIPKRLKEPGTATDVTTSRRGTTWTYVTTDQPFGLAMQQAIREFVKRRTEPKTGGEK